MVTKCLGSGLTTLEAETEGEGRQMLGFVSQAAADVTVLARPPRRCNVPGEKETRRLIIPNQSVCPRKAAFRSLLSMKRMDVSPFY